MSALGVFASLPEDHFLCPLCQEVFSDPVTTPCGHNFCKACLSQCWSDGAAADGLSRCPTCNKRSHETTEFSTNAFIAEISAQVKRRRVEAAASSEAAGGVTCDVCVGLKLKAAKSCLGCAASYCDAHLELHGRVPALMKHRLVQPLENLQERTCGKHGRILELYCRDEAVCVCLLCGQMDHKDHHTVPVEEEGARQKETIEFRKAHIKQMIGKRLENINKLANASKRSQERADEETEVSDKVFSSLRKKVKEKQVAVSLHIVEKLEESREENRAMIGELHAEVAALQKQHSQLEELQRSEDDFQLLQTLQELSRRSDTKDWSNIKIYPDPYVQTVRRAMTHLLRTFQDELKALTLMELTRMRQYKESVTFDPSTAGVFLWIYDSGTRLRHVRTATNPSSSGSERFEDSMVLGKQGFASGRHYWEVKVGLRGDWDVGVANESVDRKKSLVIKKGNGFFTIGKRKGEYKAKNKSWEVLNLCPRPKLVGVYVDCEEGRVSFYDVTQKLHIYSYKRETFTDKLFPFFYLHSTAKKSEALVLTPIADGASSL